MKLPTNYSLKNHVCISFEICANKRLKLNCYIAIFENI